MSGKWWQGYPWRLIQTNLREIDMADIDAAEYVRQLQAFGATVAMINTSGIIASYPTRLDYHFQSPYLTGDSLEKIVAAVHEAGIRVIARMDFSKVRREIYEMHPEWAFRTRDGGIVDYNGDIHVCVNSDYQQRYALEILKETLTAVDADGVYFNMGGFVQRDYSYHNHGICHCHRCREKFHSEFGLDLPAEPTLDTPAGRAYRLFQRWVMERQEQTVRRVLDDIRPGLIATRAGEEGFSRLEANTAIDRPLPRWQYEAASNTKWVVCSYEDRRVSSNACVDFIDFPARHMAVSPAQQKLRLYQSLAQRGALDYYIIGRLDNHADRSGHGAVKEVFTFHRNNEDCFRDLRPSAPILLVRDEDCCEDEYRGWYRLLAENHFLFDVVDANRLESRDWGGYRLIILPDCRYLSHHLAQRLDRFVAGGGKLLSVYRSAMGDERYQPLEKPSLGCLGVESVLADRGDMRGSYFRLEQGRFPSLCHTRLLYLDDHYLYGSYHPDCALHGKLVPPQPFGPPERCYNTHRETAHPCFTLRDFDQGKAMFLGWRLGAFYYRQGYAGYLAFARDLLRAHLEEEPVGGDLPEMVELALHRGDRFHLLTLVNNSGHFGLSFFEPVRLVERTVALHWELPVHRVRSLQAGEDLDFRLEGGYLSILLKRLDMFDALRIE